MEEILDCTVLSCGQDAPSLAIGEMEEVVSDGCEGMVDVARSFLIWRDESEARGAVCCLFDDSDESEEPILV
jgi:hypothetical protein